MWRRRDQSGNSRAAAERNAAAEGVRGRVELADADARDLGLIGMGQQLAGLKLRCQTQDSGSHGVSGPIAPVVMA